MVSYLIIHVGFYMSAILFPTLAMNDSRIPLSLMVPNFQNHVLLFFASVVVSDLAQKLLHYLTNLTGFFLQCLQIPSYFFGFRNLLQSYLPAGFSSMSWHASPLHVPINCWISGIGYINKEFSSGGIVNFPLVHSKCMLCKLN